MNVSALCSVWVWEPEAGGPESQWNDFREHAAVVIPLKWCVRCEWMTSVCFQIILWWCQPSSLHTVHPSLLFVLFFVISSFRFSSSDPPLFPSVPVCFFLFLFLSGCVFGCFSWQVNRWFWSQWRCTFSPLSPSESLFLAQQFIGVALLRRCVKCYSISPSLHHTIWMWD